MMNIVCIGGGTGQSEILRGLREHDCNITAIVAVTDSGRSTGVIRKNFDIMAPGDLRNCIAALSDSEPLVQKLFQYRFKKGVELEGMSFGNLFLTALTKIKGDMYSAIKATSKILKIKGKVYPSMLSNTHVCAELEDGSIVEEELNVRKTNKANIKKLFLKNSKVKAPKEAIEAIKKADLIIVGPGSLYTSVIVHFLVPNLKKAFNQSKAKKVFLCNMITQAGQTDEYDAKKHIKEVQKYAGKIDYVLMNNTLPPKQLMKGYEKEGGYIVKGIRNGLGDEIKILKEDLLKKETKKNHEWNKVSSIRHDPKKTVNALMKLVKRKKELKAVILAAGNSTRMRPFSFTQSKVMIEFLGKPLLAYHVEECINNGIKDIIIVCSKNNHENIKKYFSKYQNEYNTQNYKIKYVIQKEQKGPGNALLCARKYLKDCDFLLKYGDSISSEDEISKILEIYKKGMKDAIVTLRIEKINPQEYGIARFEKNKVVEIIEKPKQNIPSNKAVVGLYILDSEKFFKGLEKDQFEKEVPPPQHILGDGGKANYWITNAKRLDLGRAWNILETNKLLIERFGAKKESANISKSAKISPNSYICPDAVIGDDVIIEGYSSVNGVIEEGTKIIDSYIMKGTKIGKNCHIDSSVIGMNNFIGDNMKTIANAKNIKIYVKGRYVNPTIKKAGLFTGENVTIMKNLKSLPGKMVFPNKVITEDIKEDKLIRAILFDADNTIYATKGVAKKADIEAMKIFAKKTNKSVKEIYDIWKKIVIPLMNEKNPKKRTRKYSYMLLAKEIKTNGVNDALEIFMKTLINSIELIPGFDKIIPFLQNYKLAVITEDTSDLTLPKLRKFKLDQKFDTIITSDKIGEMKPSIDYYEKAFLKFNVQPNECLVIGDNFEKDLKIAKDMGATTISFGSQDDRADFSIKKYEEFQKILRMN